MNEGRSKQDKIKEAESQFIVSSGNVTIILNPLKETLDNVALLIKFAVKGVFHLEICFVRNADNPAAFFKLMTNRLTRVSLIGKNLFVRNGNAVKKSKSRFTVFVRRSKLHSKVAFFR